MTPTTLVFTVFGLILLAGAFTVAAIFTLKFYFMIASLLLALIAICAILVFFRLN